MIHLKEKTFEKRRFNLLFFSSLRSCSVKISITPARKSKERQTTWRRKNIIKELYCLTNNQIVFTCQVHARSLVLSQESILSILPFYLSFSLNSEQKLKIIQINFVPRERSHRRVKHKEGLVQTRIINQACRERGERSLWIWIERVFDVSCQLEEFFFLRNRSACNSFLILRT